MKELDISVVSPVYDEEENIPIIYDKLKNVLNKLNKSYEIIFIDDGSTDNSFKILEKLYNKNKNIKIIKLRTNFGQTSALNIGFKNAKGSVIVTIDSDLQNDPKDIPKLLNKLKEGYDVVSGWRFERKDQISKVFLSKISNFLRSIVTKEAIHDSGCSLKAYKRECFADLEFYGEMHRFIPTLLRWKGFKIGEVKVKHFPRKYGKSKYNYKRIFRGFVDLINAKLWMDYSTRPSYLFFKIASFNILISIGFLLYNFIRYGTKFNVGPILLASVLFFVIGIQFLSFGFLAEIQSKTYHSLNKSYNMEKILERK
ncbi:glycosyltransferase family 2 protein [Candidatus Woesearchaeota archaeon]|nr:glycosyltransferase family 2 protein [Candidatus Woesearchaeota archaeon]